MSRLSRKLFAERLRARMRVLKLSAKDVADRAGVSRQAVYMWFSHPSDTVMDETVYAACNALEVDPAYFFGPEFSQALTISGAAHDLV
jgi:transcriptional regulator with XRE-family HTH domain